MSKYKVGDVVSVKRYIKPLVKEILDEEIHGIIIDPPEGLKYDKNECVVVKFLSGLSKEDLEYTWIIIEEDILCIVAQAEEESWF